ncbi:MAG: argininosuccinate lyase, partial [Thaumarchaeota archaeon]|nr:argininosuccinate lyase [Nitrososphaerota archaeon]
MYRSRLDGKLDDVTLEFLSSISDDFVIAQYDILGSQAHTLMLLENKIINRKETIKILSALERIKKVIKEIKISEKSEAEDI